MALPLWNSKTTQTTLSCLHPNGGAPWGFVGVDSLKPSTLLFPLDAWLQINRVNVVAGQPAISFAKRGGALKGCLVECGWMDIQGGHTHPRTLVEHHTRSANIAHHSSLRSHDFWEPSLLAVPPFECR